VASRLRVWLDDGVTEAVLTSPEGMGVEQRVTLYATKAGTWRLWASADDVCGRHDQTGTVRLVTVR
jgi:hypothetical protein